MVVFRKPDSETAVVFRAIATSCVWLTVLAIPAIAQCPDGTPPPCTRPARPEIRSPRIGIASLRVLASAPVAGTTLKWQDLDKGVPLHVVVEHAVQRVPPGQTPVLVAFVNLTPDATHGGYQRVLEARVVTTRPTQRGMDWVLTREHVRQQRITVAIHIAFSATSDTNFASGRGMKLSYDWGASITLEFPVADSSAAAPASRQAQAARGAGQDRPQFDPGYSRLADFRDATEITVRPDTVELPRDDLTKALDALERKVCLTIGDRSNGPRDQCEPRVDPSTYLRPLRDVFLAAPPILKAYLCSLNRLYFDYHSPWNASFAALPDSQTGREYRSIAIRRGVLENKVRYVDWATAWTQQWWTGGPIDRPSNDPTLPRVELESRLSGPAGTLYHLVAHEVGHLLDRDYGGGLGRRPQNKPFEPGEFGYLSWTMPRYMDANGVMHQAVARDSAIEAVRQLDFDGNVNARIAMMAAAGNGPPFDPGVLAVEHWPPASRDGIATFLDRLAHSPFTTVFSTWRPEDDWTESFTVMMLPSITRRFNIVTAHRTRVRVLTKVLDAASPFAPKRRFIQEAIDRALTNFRARQAASPSPCLAVALAESLPR